MALLSSFAGEVRTFGESPINETAMWVISVRRLIPGR